MSQEKIQLTETEHCTDCRSTWLSTDEPCHQKLSFELWTAMIAEGPLPNADAQHVRANCLLSKDIGMLQLRTREVYFVFHGQGEMGSILP